MTSEMKPPARPELDARATITVTARLAQLMAEEVDLLSEMKISSIEALQKEKLFLIAALDAQRRLISQKPELVDTIPSQDKRDLQEVVEVFNNVLEENHRKLLLAREVNQRIVQAITSVVKDSTRRAGYDGTGMAGSAPFETLSVTLNQTA